MTLRAWCTFLWSRVYSYFSPSVPMIFSGSTATLTFIQINDSLIKTMRMNPESPSQRQCCLMLVLSPCLFLLGAFSESCPKFLQGAPNETSGVQQSAALPFLRLANALLLFYHTLKDIIWVSSLVCALNCSGHFDGGWFQKSQ